VSLTTNGTLLTPSFLARHAAVRWSHVRVSLNAGSEATHARMTGKRLFVQTSCQRPCRLTVRSRLDCWSMSFFQTPLNMAFLMTVRTL
jgi:hypothetical protein